MPAVTEPATDPSRADGFAHLDRARMVRIETPEHVRLGFELAGIGSRFAAAVLDAAILFAVLVASLVGLASLGAVTASEVVEALGVTAGILVVFALQWGYFFLCEAFFGGRTIGKKALGIRVIGAEGTPITREAAALRNLLRVIDVQPVGSSLIGLGLVALHPRAQRLGDIVAGTVVVRDRGSEAMPEEQTGDAAAGMPVMSAERFGVLEKYLARRDSLEPSVRAKLRASVVRAMGAALGTHGADADDALARLYREERPRQLGAGSGTGASLQAAHLVRSQSKSWARCRELVDKASRSGLAHLTEAEIDEFTSLYREVSADLARAKTYDASLRLSFHLERLVGEAHNLFYRSARRDLRAVSWVRNDFPRLFRRHLAPVSIAAALLFVPAAVAYTGVRADPELGRRLVPPSMVTRAEEARARLEAGEPYVDVPQVQMSVFSSTIMTNNVQVAFIAAAGGILAGIGTVLILVLNGVSIGSVLGLYHAHGAGSLIWTFVLPHGVLELTAIVVAGAAGLLLGRAIVTPGRRTRGRALREDGRQALALVAGAAFLLVVAGLVEGFVSPARIDGAIKLGFAAVVAACLLGYLAAGGRAPGDDQVTEARVP
jgi:uncharacterized membrane protein SpoIIM required for sporulation/uncharacterized RDD family membrane protein YckC